MTEEFAVITVEEQAALTSWLSQLFTNRKGEGMRHRAYSLTCDHADELAPHARKVRPDDLLKTVRPGEPKNIQDYRLAVWQPVTYTDWTRAVNVIYRIFQPGGFHIFYKDVDSPQTKELPLRTYCEDAFGDYYSLMNFVKDVAIPDTLADPNAVIAMLPSVNDPERMKEVLPTVFLSHNVLYRDREIFILKSDDKSVVTVGQSQKMIGVTGYIMTATDTYRFMQVGKAEDMQFQAEVIDRHGLGYIPARVTGGTVNSFNGVTFYTSLLAGVVPQWNKAIVLSSEMDGFTFRHLNPHLVRAQTPCPTCKGAGTFVDASNKVMDCSPCGGSGFLGINTNKTGSPYQDTTFDIKALKDMGISSVDGLMAYVAPPTQAFEQFRQMIAEHVQAGFSSVNMDILNKVGANQSGIAKSIDRQDLNSFLASCAEHFFDQIEWLYKVVIDMMYRPVVGDAAADEMFPAIARPRRFDYVTLDGILTEAKEAKEAGVHPSIQRGINLQVAGTMFGNDSTEAKMVRAQIELDPYEGMSEDELLTLKTMNVIDSRAVYIHANIASLVSQAITERPDFLFLSLDDQREIIDAIVVKKLAEMQGPGLPAKAETITDLLTMGRRIQSGTLTPQAAISMLQDMGLPPEQAASLVASLTPAE